MNGGTVGNQSTTTQSCSFSPYGANFSIIKKKIKKLATLCMRVSGVYAPSKNETLPIGNSLGN